MTRYFVLLSCILYVKILYFSLITPSSMGSDIWEQCLRCPCCKLGEHCRSFKEFINLKDTGLVMYQLSNIKDDDPLNSTCNTTEDILIVHNNQDVQIISADLIPAIEKNDISCPRCRNAIERAEKLLQKNSTIKKTSIICLCNHCLQNARSKTSCNGYQKHEKRIGTEHELKEQTWISKIMHLLKDKNRDNTRTSKKMLSSKYVSHRVCSSEQSGAYLDKSSFRRGIEKTPDTQGVEINRASRIHLEINPIKSKHDSLGLVKSKEVLTKHTHVPATEINLRLSKKSEHFPKESSTGNIQDINETEILTEDMPKAIFKGLRKHFESKVTHDLKIKKGDIPTEIKFKPPKKHFLVNNKEKLSFSSELYRFTSQSTTNVSLKILTPQVTSFDGFEKHIKPEIHDEFFTSKHKKGTSFSEDLRNKPYIGKDVPQLQDFEGLISLDTITDVSELNREQKPEPKFADLRKNHTSDLLDRQNKTTEKPKRTFAPTKKYHSEESLITLGAEDSMYKDFNYYFPKDMIVKKKLKRVKSSSELILDTRNMLLAREEMQRKKKEEELVRELEEKELKRLAEEEKKRLIEKEKRETDEEALKLKDAIRIAEDKHRTIEEEPRKLKEEKTKGRNNKPIKYKSSNGSVNDTQESTRKKNKEFTKAEKESDKTVKEKGKIQKEESIILQKGSIKKDKQGEKEKEQQKENNKFKDESEKLRKDKDLKQIKKQDQEIEKNNIEQKKNKEHKENRDALIEDQKIRNDKPEGNKIKANKLEDTEGHKIEGKKKGGKEEGVTDGMSKENQKGKVDIGAEELKKALLERAKEKENTQKMIRQQEESERKAREAATKKEKEATPTMKPEPDKENPIPQNTKKNPTTKDLNINTIRMRRPSTNDDVLQLVKLKQSGPNSEKNKAVRLSQLNITPLVKEHKGHKNARLSTCLMCIDSDFEIDVENIVLKKDQTEKFADIVIGQKIFKYKPPLIDKNDENLVVPLIFQSVHNDETSLVHDPKNKKYQEKARNEALSVLPTKPGKATEQESFKGIIRYSLSDRTFIDKGWTMLPTEKVVRKMNVYRMRPAHPEFDWFEHNKNKRLIFYDSGEKLAEFDDNGLGRWFYRNGRIALDYYDAEEINAQQRIVIYSSGEPDERGRTHPLSILATFDYLGNGIVFDHSGKIRLKYNQTEGIVLDRNVGPVSHWKWHTLNDPPVLQKVMIDTQLSHKDPEILKMGGRGDDKTRPDNEEMLAIEFDNFIKEKSKKLSQTFKPFQIKMKALKINEHFSLKVLDQATIYLIFRDGTSNLKLNIGMILDHKEIVDTDTAEVGEVSNNLERFPARTDSLAGLQRSVAYAQRYERLRTERERRLHPTELCASADRLTAAASRPLHPPFRTCYTTDKPNCSRKLSSTNVYYNTRLL